MAAEIDFNYATDVRGDTRIIRGDMLKLSPLLKSPMTTATPPAWKKAEFDLIFTEIEDHFNGAGGMITKLTNEIGNSTS